MGDAATPGRVAYQGAAGSFSHEACLALRPWDEAVGFDSFADAIEALHSGDCGCALIPVENTTVGVVEPAASLVREAALDVVGEVWRPIRLALMAAPGARLSDIRTAESHPAALGQCMRGLAVLRIAAVEAFDTAGAARAVAEAGDPTRAAVAPAGAADVYGLVVLRNDLQDSADNRTRFVLLRAASA
ncbi:prephenate dehydratase [Brevundimonas sp. S30B]|uniref:prephenate dehydratase domain-containing protein n=1 Tax=unclassified Brevundimonas TaxID=2622653 RepID=UPI001072DD02|nr:MULTISPECIES: prephenate dehydratase domain-containing protein [unclassified Brevundimonas]QBX37776.1 prephenate dehydratase [Brevundimonas sp. MF30-B]TFW02870.1 prephenate dehydratase [Brevundimonas sp. S30B]